MRCSPCSNAARGPWRSAASSTSAGMDAGRSSKLGYTLAMTTCLTCSVGETQMHPVAGGDRLTGQRPAFVQLLLIERVVVHQVHAAFDQGAHAGRAGTDEAGMG